MSYFVGLDLGQAQDYTALSVLQVVGTEYHIRHLQRFRLGTSYPDVVAETGKMMATLQDAVLVVDNTGVGRPVVDLFRQAQLRPVAITITGGDTAVFEGGAWRVPKRDLVGALAVAFQSGTLKIAPDLPEAKTLIEELLNFKVKINLKTAHDSYEAWREGVHDDLVLSVAMALYYAARPRPHFRASAFKNGRRVS
jgi:phage terminase large subunit-like protein